MAEDKQQVTKTDRSRRRHSHRNRRRRTKNKPASALCLCWLPDDVLYRILSFCNLRDLGRLAQTCQRFACLVGADWTWIRISRRLTMVRDYTKRSKNFNNDDTRQMWRLVFILLSNWMKFSFVFNFNCFQISS